MWRNMLGEDSLFGRVMSRVGIIIYTNLLFIFFSIPLVTIGASFSALHYTLMKYQRGDGKLRIIPTFWKGFKESFKKSTIAFLALVLLLVTQALEITWCRQFTGFMSGFQYALIGLMIFESILALYLFPVIAAFNGPMTELLKDALYFAFSGHVKMLACAALHVVPLAACYMFLQYLPLWAFLWGMFGFALIVYLSDKIMLSQFVPFLPMVDICGDIIPEGMEDDPNIIVEDTGDDSMDEKTLAEMMKYGL